MAEDAVEKIEDQLNCSICLDVYTDPKLLICFHVYCRACLALLVHDDPPVITCPTCRHDTPIPPKGVAGLQSAFQVNYLLEILHDFKKGKQDILYCPQHENRELVLYCETCEELICIQCTIQQHHDHQHVLISEKHRPDPRPPLLTSAKQQLDEAMKEGSVDYQGIDSVLVGIAGAGKTHVLAMILDENLPDQRVSTPCTRPPVRTIAQVTVNEDCGVLERVEGEKYFSIVTDTVREVASSLPPTFHSPMVSHVPRSMRKLEEKIIQCLQRNNSNSLQTCKLLNKLRWNRLMDSGGQPQFLEVIPIFLHHISLVIFVIKLNERLDAFPMIEFYNHAGNSVSPPYKSCYSQEQVIRHFMRAFISQGGQGMGVKFLFIGTHKDRMEESKDESIQDKNEKLKKIIVSFDVRRNVIHIGRDPIFAVNAKTPDDGDWKVMKQVRNMLVQSTNVPPISIPIRWFAMELALQHFVQETKQAVLLESKCLELVANFHFNATNFKAALNYLHQIKHIFYYKSGVKRLVVADIAVIQNKLSEVVGFSIELTATLCNAVAVDYKWIKLGECGILHISCLDRFPNHYISGVFTPKDLMQLFISLCIVSKLSSEEYLMPCALPVEETAFCNPEPWTQSVPAMVVEFPDGGPMLGSFCGLVCYLINVGKWQLVTKRNGEPLNISRKSVQYLVPDFPGKVTINDPLSTFFLVTFHGPSEVASQVCPLIRETILTGIREVSKNLNYLGKNEAASFGTQTVITFLCTCETTPLHPATMVSRMEYLMCPSFGMSEAVTAEHKTWLEGHVPSTMCHPSLSSATATVCHLSATPTVCHLSPSSDTATVCHPSPSSDTATVCHPSPSSETATVCHPAPSSETPSPSSTHPSPSSETATHPSPSSETATHPSLSSETATHPSLSSETPTHPSLSSETATHPSPSSETATHPSLSSETATHPSLSSETATHPSLSSETTTLLTLSSETATLLTLSSETATLLSLSSETATHPSPSSETATVSGGHGGMTIVMRDQDVVFLMDHLCQHSYKWEVIGTALHFLPGELENIKHSPQATTLQQRLKKVLCQWVQWPTTAHSQTPTMEMLRDALRSDLVGLGAVANQLYDVRNQLPSQCVSPPPSATASGGQGETCELELRGGTTEVPRTLSSSQSPDQSYPFEEECCIIL